MGTNQGPGRAFDRGFRRALEVAPEDGFVVTLEADTTSDLDALGGMLELARGGADVVLASTHAPGGGLSNVGFFRRVLSRSASYAIRRTSGVDARTVDLLPRLSRLDPARRLRPARRDARARARLRLQGGAVFKLSRLGARLEEVPVVIDWSQREGESKMRVLPTMVAYARPDDAAGVRTPRTGGGVSTAMPLRARDPEAPRVAVVGAGLLGLSAAYRLAQAGMSVTVYERDAELGGLAGTTPLDGIPIDRFYHVTLPTDERVIELARSSASATASASAAAAWGSTTRAASPRCPRPASCSGSRGSAPSIACGSWRSSPAARSGRTTAVSRRPHRGLARRICGRRTWEVLWRPLLDSKFDGRYQDLPATYLWSRSRRMSGSRDKSSQEMMGALDGGYQTLVDALGVAIERLGGRPAEHRGEGDRLERRPRRRDALHARLRGARPGDLDAPAHGHRAAPGPRPGRRGRPRPLPLPRHRLPRDAPAAQPEPLVHAEHHRSPHPAHRSDRDDPRRSTPSGWAARSSTPPST